MSGWKSAFKAGIKRPGTHKRGKGEMNMLKWFNNKKKDNKGFSIVELIIVVAIMAILVGLLAPQYIKYVEKSRKSADATNMDTLVNAVQVRAADAETDIPVGTYTITLKKDAEPVFKKDGTPVKATQGNVKGYQFVDAIAENVADYKSVRLKSNKWTEDPTAHITVTKDGSTTITYSGADFAEFIDKTASSNK